MIICDYRHVIGDTALIHEFCGNHLADVSRNGQLRDPEVNKLFENAVRTKAVQYHNLFDWSSVS